MEIVFLFLLFLPFLYQLFELIKNLLQSKDNWSHEDINNATTWAHQGSLVGLDDTRLCLQELNGPKLMKDLLNSIEDYQRNEAKRRVLEKVYYYFVSIYLPR